MYISLWLQTPSRTILGLGFGLQTPSETVFGAPGNVYVFKVKCVCVDIYIYISHSILYIYIYSLLLTGTLEAKRLIFLRHVYSFRFIAVCEQISIEFGDFSATFDHWKLSLFLLPHRISHMNIPYDSPCIEHCSIEKAVLVKHTRT